MKTSALAKQSANHDGTSMNNKKRVYRSCFNVYVTKRRACIHVETVVFAKTLTKPKSNKLK